MKIFNRATFLALPPGTVFSKYRPIIFGELSIKGESTEWNDFYAVSNLAAAVKSASSEDFFNILDKAQKTGGSVEMDLEEECRDGAFEEDEVWFSVWEEADVRALIARLKRCLPEDNPLDQPAIQPQ